MQLLKTKWVSRKVGVDINLSPHRKIWPAAPDRIVTTLSGAREDEFEMLHLKQQSYSLAERQPHPMDLLEDELMIWKKEMGVKQKNGTATTQKKSIKKRVANGEGARPDIGSNAARRGKGKRLD